MSEKTFKIVGNDISDGYHTFDELYDHRCLLYLCWVLEQPFTRDTYFVRDHFEGWDCIVMQLGVGQVSYHVPAKYRYLYEKRIREGTADHQYDGHTSADVLKRLEENARTSFGDPE